MTDLLPYHDTYPHTGSGPGKGEMVLLHGWGMNSLVWDELIPFLNEEFDITLIDLPGLGRSPLPSGDYTIETLSEQVLAIAPEKAHWIGWSLGALLVQKIALTNPERLQSAFCVSGTPSFVCRDDWKFAMPLEVFEKFQALLEEDWEGTLIRFLTLQCKGSETIREDTKNLREILFHHGLPAIKALREGLQVLKQNDLRENLAEKVFDFPFCYLLGQFDTLIPVQVTDDIEALNKGFKVRQVKGASHVPHLSHPQLVASEIQAVIGGLG